MDPKRGAQQFLEQRFSNRIPFCRHVEIEQLYHYHKTKWVCYEKYFLLIFMMIGVALINAQEKYLAEDAARHIKESAIVSGEVV